MTARTQLDSLYDFETRMRDRVWLTQPMGGGVVKDFTFGQAMHEARRMAAHLGSLGLPPGSRIALFAKNNAWWFLSDIAIWMAGHVSVPLYPTLTPDTIGQILDHSEARLIFVGKLDGFAGMEPGIPRSMPRIRLPLAPAMDAPKWEDLVAKAAPVEGTPRRDPKDLATLIYTSGSTGVPKGVMHSFETMCASRGFSRMLGLTAEDRVLSYLPLAHAFERTVIETQTYLTGFHVYFAESLETFVSDIRRARPTLFVSVPRLWQKFQSGVFEKMPPEKLARLMRLPIVRNVVRKKILAGLGFDQVRVAGSGSAPIPAELIEWYRELGLELLEGYGMTENFSYSHMTRPGEVRVGYVGPTHVDVEHRLSEGGEVLVKSPATMLGYYKAPELTAEVLGADGFLKTGDLGELDERGRLKITGRAKELFKTSKGKYVAPSPIENKLLLHPDVEQACVSGANQPQPFGMVVLSPQARRAAADAAQRERIGASIAAHMKALNEELDQHERLEKVVVIADEWTIDNGMLTPTMKLRRAAVEGRYAPRVDEWYAEKKTVIWG
jgi:long-subunit acyl-CoA synthetase (AMP-forming)